MTDSATPEIVRSRRAVLAAAAGGAAALAASPIGPATVAAAAGNMQTETDNATTLPTRVSNSTADSQALFGHATAAGNGVEGTSIIGHGVRGISSDTSDPVTNQSIAGVVGVGRKGRGSARSGPQRIERGAREAYRLLLAGEIAGRCRGSTATAARRDRRTKQNPGCPMAAPGVPRPEDKETRHPPNKSDG